MKEEKRIVLDIESAARIESGVKNNGRSIADNSIKLDLLSDDVKELKEDVRSMSDIMAEMKDDVLTLIELNIEQKKTNQDIAVLLDQVMSLQKKMRRDIDKILDREYLKVGVI